MKKIFLTSLILAFIGSSSAVFAKSRSRSKSSGSKSSATKSNTASNKTQPTPSAKAGTGTDKDKQSKMHKNTRTHRCKLPNGKIDTGMSQEECARAGGKWVKY